VGGDIDRPVSEESPESGEVTPHLPYSVGVT
jgi:hypothetical protein